MGQLKACRCGRRSSQCNIDDDGKYDHAPFPREGINQEHVAVDDGLVYTFSLRSVCLRPLQLTIYTTGNTLSVKTNIDTRRALLSK